MSFRIRPIEAADLEIARAVLSSYVAELEAIDVEAARRVRSDANDLSSFPQVRKQYLKQGGMFFVMTDRDRIIGVGGLRRVLPEMCELRQLVLLRPFRGRGLGHEMALSLIEWARDNDYQAIRLELRASQKDAQKLFSQLRFAALVPASGERGEDSGEITLELDLRRKPRYTS